MTVQESQKMPINRTGRIGELGMKKTDLRIIRTKKSIREAFLNLLEIKAYKEISIQNIADEAMINRNTFYAHYQDKDYMLESLVTESIDGLRRQLPEITVENNQMDVRTVMTDILKYIERNLRFYQLMKKNDDISHISYQIKNVLGNHLLDGLRKQQNINKAEERLFRIVNEYKLQGILGLILVWIDNYTEYSIDELVNIMFIINKKCYISPSEITPRNI